MIRPYYGSQFLPGKRDSRVLKASSLCQYGQLCAVGQALCCPPVSLSAWSALRVTLSTIMMISTFRQRAEGCLSNIWALLGFRFDGEPGVPIYGKLIFEGLGVLKCPSPYVYRIQVWSGPGRGGRHKVGGPQHMPSHCVFSVTLMCIKCPLHAGHWAPCILCMISMNLTSSLIWKSRTN